MLPRQPSGCCGASTVKPILNRGGAETPPLFNIFIYMSLKPIKHLGYSLQQQRVIATHKLHHKPFFTAQ